MPYYSGQGRVFAGKRDENGNPEGLLHLGNIPDLNISFNVDTTDHRESMSGQRLQDLLLITGKSGELSMTMEEFITSNIELMFYANTVKRVPGTVVDEPLPTALVTGELYLLKNQNVSDVIVTDALDQPIPETAYTVNPAGGSISFSDVTGITTPLTVSYDYGATNTSVLFTQPLPERWFRFEGLNTADNNAPVIVDLYRVSMQPAQSLGLINEALGQFPTTGSVLADLTKPADGELGQFGRIIRL